MKTFYIPVRFYEQDPNDNDLIMLVTGDNVHASEIRVRLESLTARYLLLQDAYPSTSDLFDAIMDALAKEVGGIWNYCETLPQFVFGEPGCQTETTGKMRKVGVAELAELLTQLNPGESLDFYESYDEKTGDVEGAFRAVMLQEFDSYVILINCFGGGLPCVMDITNFQIDLKRQRETLAEYLDNTHTNHFVFVRGMAKNVAG